MAPMKAMKAAKAMKAMKVMKDCMNAKARKAAKASVAAIAVWRARGPPPPPHQPGFDGFWFTSRVRNPEEQNIPRVLGPGTTTLAIYVPRESAATLSTELIVVIRGANNSVN